MFVKFRSKLKFNSTYSIRWQSCSNGKFTKSIENFVSTLVDVTKIVFFSFFCIYVIISLISNCERFLFRAFSSIFGLRNSVRKTTNYQRVYGCFVCKTEETEILPDQAFLFVRSPNFCTRHCFSFHCSNFKKFSCSFFKFQKLEWNWNSKVN